MLAQLNLQRTDLVALADELLDVIPTLLVGALQVSLQLINAGGGNPPEEKL